MVQTLILICSLTLPRAECTVESARAVLQGPEVVICATVAPQALLASTALRARPGEYVIVKCERNEA